MADRPRFQHEPPDLSKRQIRLLRVLRQTSSSIECSLDVYDLDAMTITWFKPGTSGIVLPFGYKALSYTWGSQYDYEDNGILINGSLATFGGNLWHFLLEIATGRLPFQGDKLWIDQICIDQEDENEKPHQVRQMGDTFANADTVIIWLGIPMGYSSAASEALGVIARQYGSSKVVSAYDTDDIVSFQSLLARNTTGFDVLVENDYWNRVWVVQEILLAQRRIVACGSQHPDWSAFKHAYQDGTGMRAPKWIKSPRHGRYAQLDEFLDAEQFRPRIMLELLGRFGHCNCKDSRDKVYGLLGLSLANSIEVNYQKSPASIY